MDTGTHSDAAIVGKLWTSKDLQHFALKPRSLIGCCFMATYIVQPKPFDCGT